MDCPVCRSVKLVISERQGIEIDFCPECRGVWLDRGELDKIIEKSLTSSQPINIRDTNYKKNYDDHYNNEYKKKKRDSFLSDLFDF